MQSIKSKQWIGIISLLFCTMIWGSAFVFQSKAGEYIPPFYLNSIRFFIGGLFLLPFVFVLKFKKRQKFNRNTFVGGFLVGIALCVASNIQQFGVMRTTPGKAGFLTAMNIVFVPVFSFLFLKRKISWKQGIAILFSLLGVGLLTLNQDFTINFGDVLCLCCALFFAIHILLVEHFSKSIDALVLSMISFFVCSLFSLCFAVPLESIQMDSVWKGLPYIGYLGVFSCGVAYTLQVVGQKRISSIPATVMLSLESVWSVVFSFLILKEKMNVKEIIGCVIMLGAVIMIQILKEEPYGRANE